ncbi:MAG: hypothetical protein P8Y81_16200, partial [Ignavibacteriaceae bacterium]
MLKLILSFSLVLFSFQIFSQEFSDKSEKILNFSEEVFNKKLNENENLFLSENDKMRMMQEQILANTYIVDEYIIQQWNTTTNVWDNYLKFNPEYNSQNLLIDSLVLMWNGSSWESYFRVVYTYTGTGLEATNTYQTWGGTDWVYGSRKSTTYDAGDRPTELLYETWSGASWENSSRYQKQYNTHGKLQTEIYQYWSGGAWMNSSRQT